MSFPEDGIDRNELHAYILNSAHHFAENLSSHRRENQEDEALAEAAVQTSGPLVELSRRCIRLIAAKAADVLLASDLSTIEGMAMAGQTMYDPNKIDEVIKPIVDSVYADLKAAGTLEIKGHEDFDVDVYTDRGRRAQMEDRHSVIEDFNAYLNKPNTSRRAFFGVYDGHGGVEAAKFVEAQLPYNIGSHPLIIDNPEEALVQAFLATDKHFLEKAARESYNSGATACTVYICDSKMYVSWLGDSQVMMCKGGTHVALMDPHKPNREDEKKRIEDNAGVVVWYGAWRVNGVLSVARAIGDRKLKQWVIGRPDVAVFDLDGTEEYLVLGCDGLWDVLTPDKVVSLIAEWTAQPQNIGVKGLAKYLVTQCLEDPSSSDNISIIVVQLPKKS